MADNIKVDDNTSITAENWRHCREEINRALSDPDSFQLDEPIVKKIWARFILQLECDNNMPELKDIEREFWNEVSNHTHEGILDPKFRSDLEAERDELLSSQREILEDIRSKAIESQNWAGYGAHDASWLANYDVYLKGNLLPEVSRLVGLMEIAKSAGWWWPFERAAIVSERHCVCRLENGRLHCEDGPAIMYPDGWKIWRINGVVVDEQIVMRPETQTIEQIQNEPNLEVQRIRIERYGWVNYLKAVNAEVIDVRRNDIEGSMESLFKIKWGNNVEKRVLVCRCTSTHKVFALEVPTQINTAREAQAWLSGGASEYLIDRA